MLKDYRELANSLKEYFLSKENWIDIEFDQEAKLIINKLDSVNLVNDFSINMATGSDNHIILPSQYLLYAIQVKELALSINDHLSVVDRAKEKFSPERLDELKDAEEVINKLGDLDDYSKKIALKPIFEESFNFNAKSLINSPKGNYKYRTTSDFFSSIILQVINVPNASSAILGHFIYALCQNPDLYNKLEKKYASSIDAFVFEKNINNYAYRLLSFVDAWNSLDKLLDYLVANDDERYYSVQFGSQKLVSIFLKSNKVLEPKDVERGGKERFFLNPIKQVNGAYLYLSTEWTYKKDSRLDLENLISIVQDLYGLKTIVSDGKFILTKKEQTTPSVGSKLKIKPFNTSLKESNLIYDERFCSRFVINLATKPFLILTGLSGSGKTKLAQAFSEWICNDDDQINLVPVGADWTNREPLLGYPNALQEGKYVLPESGVLQLILNAQKDTDRPYFLILDEMNLSHVERYFADFLSAIESNKEIKLHFGEKPWEVEGYHVPSTIYIPKNLFIIGTVNIDETTYMFSPKVLDRANVIEFRVSQEELVQFLKNPADIDLEKLNGKGASMAENFVQIAKNEASTFSQKELLSEELLKFFSELNIVGAEFGYRTAFEIQRFAALAEQLAEDWGLEQIMDAAISQKLLPKLHGSRRKLKDVLLKLGDLCHPDLENGCKDLFKNHKDITEEIRDKAKYPISFEKIARMHKALMDNGFTSFAEA